VSGFCEKGLSRRNDGREAAEKNGRQFPLIQKSRSERSSSILKKKKGNMKKQEEKRGRGGLAKRVVLGWKKKAGSPFAPP